jgi:hypothetical protein
MRLRFSDHVNQMLDYRVEAKRRDPRSRLGYRVQAWLSGKPAVVRVRVDNSNDRWGDAGGRTKESQVVTSSPASPEPSLDFLQRLWFSRQGQAEAAARW